MQAETLAAVAAAPAAAAAATDVLLCMAHCQGRRAVRERALLLQGLAGGVHKVACGQIRVPGCSLHHTSMSRHMSILTMQRDDITIVE